MRLGHRYALSALGQSFLYVVAKGVVGVQCATNTEKRVITQLLYPGDILVPALQAPLPEAMLIAKPPVEFWRLTMTALAGDLASDSKIWQSVFYRLNAQNARAQLHAAATTMLNCEQRIAGFLVEVAGRLGTSNGRAISFDLPLSRYSIADYLSLNADTVSRTLSGFAASKIIERRGRFHVSIRDWESLINICPLSDVVVRLHGCSEAGLS